MKRKRIPRILAIFAAISMLLTSMPVVFADNASPTWDAIYPEACDPTKDTANGPKRQEVVQLVNAVSKGDAGEEVTLVSGDFASAHSSFSANSCYGWDSYSFDLTVEELTNNPKALYIAMSYNQMLVNGWARSIRQLDRALGLKIDLVNGKMNVYRMRAHKGTNLAVAAGYSSFDFWDEASEAEAAAAYEKTEFDFDVNKTHRFVIYRESTTKGTNDLEQFNMVFLMDGIVIHKVTVNALGNNPDPNEDDFFNLRKADPMHIIMGLNYQDLSATPENAITAKVLVDFTPTHTRSLLNSAINECRSYAEAVTAAENPGVGQTAFADKEAFIAAIDAADAAWWEEEAKSGDKRSETNYYTALTELNAAREKFEGSVLVKDESWDAIYPEACDPTKDAASGPARQEVVKLVEAAKNSSAGSQVTLVSGSFASAHSSFAVDNGYGWDSYSFDLTVKELTNSPTELYIAMSYNQMLVNGWACSIRQLNRALGLKIDLVNGKMNVYRMRAHKKDTSTDWYESRYTWDEASEAEAAAAYEKTEFDFDITKTHHFVIYRESTTTDTNGKQQFNIAFLMDGIVIHKVTVNAIDNNPDPNEDDFFNLRNASPMHIIMGLNQQGLAATPETAITAKVAVDFKPTATRQKLIDAINSGKDYAAAVTAAEKPGVGETTIVAKNAFMDAIDAANAVWQDEESKGVEKRSEINYYAALTDLNAARKIFEDSVVKYLPGDANGDNEVNATDLAALRKCILNSEYNEAADLSGDGKLDIIDLIKLKKLLASAQQEVKISIDNYDTGKSDYETLSSAINDIKIKTAAAKKSGNNVTYTLVLGSKKKYSINKPLELTGCSDFTIDGAGSTIVMTERQTAVKLNYCNNVTLSNLSLDYDPLWFTQGTVTAVSGTVLTLKIDEGYRDDIENFLTKEYSVLRLHDPKTGGHLAGSTVDYEIKATNRTSSGIIKATMSIPYTDTASYRPKAGDRFSLYECVGGAVIMTNCTNTKYTYFNIYGSMGFGIHEIAGPGGTVMKSCNIIPGPKPNGATAERMISTLGDGTHFQSVKNGPRLYNCTITHCCDDGINAHGFFYRVVKTAGNNEMWLAFVNADDWAVGETVNVFETEDYNCRGSAVIAAFELIYDASLSAPQDKLTGTSKYVSGWYYHITLDEPIEGIAVGDDVSNPSRMSSNAAVINCTFGYNRARGIVLKGENSVIENNTVTGSSAAGIMVISELSWAEGGFSNGSVIRNNRVISCGLESRTQYGSSSVAAIMVLLTPKNKCFYSGKGAENITIADNVITDTGAFGLFVSNCKGITVRGNKVTNPFVAGINNIGSVYGVTPKSGILIGMCENITAEDNAVTCEKSEITQAVDILNNCSSVLSNKRNILN